MQTGLALLKPFAYRASLDAEKASLYRLTEHYIFRGLEPPNQELHWPFQRPGIFKPKSVPKFDVRSQPANALSNALLNLISSDLQSLVDSDPFSTTEMPPFWTSKHAKGWQENDKEEEFQQKYKFRRSEKHTVL